MKIKAIWQASFFWIFMPIFTIFIISPSLILGFLTRQYWWVALTQRLWGNLLFFGGGQPFTIEGKEHLDQGKPYVIIANHSSVSDIPVLAATVKTPVSWVIKDSLLKVPLLKYAFLLGLGIPIVRDNARHAQRRILKRIRQVQKMARTSIIIFPEGTRSRDGSVKEFKRGFVRIMKEYGLDILPISLSGFNAYLPPGKMIPNPSGRLKMIVHPPIPASHFEGKDEREICEEMCSLIAASVK